MDTGPYVLAAEPIELNAGRPRRTLTVSNTGDRAIQVGSHFHFFEVNRALRFDRAAAFGMRLDIPSGTALRFEPGDTRPVDLVPFGGTGRSVGFNALTDGSVRGSSAAALERARRAGFSPGGVESGGTDVASGVDGESRAPGVSHRAGAGGAGHAGREGGA